jgi:hypothetical protein
MSHNALVCEPLLRTRHPAGPIALDGDFEARWAAWQPRGVAHERAVRRKLVRLTTALAIAAAIVYGLWHR